MRKNTAEKVKKKKKKIKTNKKYIKKINNNKIKNK
jgi:hypothetical protein